MTPQEILSILVRDWMKRQRLSVRAAAKRLGMAEMSLWRRVHGHRQWRADELLRLSDQGIRISSELFHALVDAEEVSA